MITKSRWHDGNEHEIVFLILETDNSAVDVDTQVSATYPQDPTIDSTTLISEAQARPKDIQNAVGSMKGEVTVDFTVAPERIETFRNKVVLGRNPTKTIVNQGRLPLIQTKVVLYNIYSYLENSGRYCNQCLTLFPKKKALDSHRELVHTKPHYPTKCGCINDKDSHSCSICGKEFNYSDLQCHLRHVHQIQINSQVKTKKKFNSHTEKALVQKMSNMRIEMILGTETGEQTKTLKSANVFKYNTEREIVKKGLNEKRSLSELKQHIDETNIKKKVQIETSNALRNSKATKNLSNLDDTHVQDAETESSENYTCFHCDMTFDTQKVLIEHLYTIMQLKNINSEVCVKKNPDHKSSKSDVITLF